MKRIGLTLALAAGILAASSSATAFIFRMGDSVWVDGKKYSWEEWKKIRDDPELAKQSQQHEAAGTAAGAGPRAASCTTAIYYDEFPSDDEKFQCTAGLGALTRGQIQEKGWKVDFVEKVPPPAGEPAQSPRGLPLNLYKLVISRTSTQEQPSSSPEAPARRPRSPPRTDTLCVNDCLGNGGTKDFCADRCTN